MDQTVTKRCPRCGVTQCVDQFYQSKQTKDKLFGWCVSCTNQKSLECHRANREVRIVQMRANTLHRRYKITPEKYEEMLTDQGGGCAICGTTPEVNGGRLAVDHDHECCPGRDTCGKCVRQLLCIRCNRRLISHGLDLLEKAVAYLKEYIK